MFYSHTILARKSPLGTVWIAAHLERKIKKPQIDGIDIPSYAESIMFPEVPIALRLSGHLLLGLVRIYSWKVQYLFQDCNRMLTTIRTAFASVQVDLPIDADHAPFESITLPPTLNLDDLNLDDAISLIDTPDNHQKTHDQITLPEGEYVMIELDEDARVEQSGPGPSLHMGPTTILDETSPPFHDGFGANNNPNEEAPIDLPVGNSPVNSNKANQTDGALDPPEKMREAPHESPHLKLTESILGIGNDDPMDLDHDSSPFVQNKAITPVIDETASAGRQVPGRSTSNLPTPSTFDAFVDDGPLNFDIPLPEFGLQPSPPPVQEKEDNRRPKAQVNNRKRKRGMKFDHKIVLSNECMRKQIDGAELDELICKRRKLPQTSLDTWRFSRTNRKGNFLLEPLLHGMCSNLQETYERNYPCVSGLDAECSNVAGVANDGQDAPPERQLSPNVPGTAELPYHEPAPTSPGNAEAQPEPLPTIQSSGAAGAALDDDMLPELPRFSPIDVPSPIRENDTPYKTPGGTPPSWLGGTAVSEIPSTDGTLGGTAASEIPSTDGKYSSLPGQSTHDSDNMSFLFPINEDDDQPEIPGLMSTPGGVSSVGTRTTGLGSMSARTRAVAMFFKDHVPSPSSDEQPGKFSLNKILEGKTRKQAARMFFETTVLKSYDYIDVQQGKEPFGDIEISVKPSLSAAKL